MTTRVTDMSVDELKFLIQETVTQAFTELLNDPDKGLELREDMREALQVSLEAVKSGKETTSAEDVATRLGLNW